MLGIDITIPILAGTERAVLLTEAWTRRQAEFKMVVETLVKPAEYMAELSSILRNTSHTEDAVLQETLKELEFLLSDIDNARDFHTIGAWPTLVGILDEKYSEETRARAAWAIGSAVKNSYDYQLWTLERFQPDGNVKISDISNVSDLVPAIEPVDISNSKSCLEMLVNIIWESGYPKQHDSGSIECKVINDAKSVGRDHLLRRTLYAVFTAARGNPDVQDALLAIDLNFNKFASRSSNDSTTDLMFESKFVNALESLLISQPSCPIESLEVPRKVWAFVSDVMDEWDYAKGTLLKSNQLTTEMKAALEQLPMIGEQFCNMRWGHNIITSLHRVLSQYSLVSLNNLFDNSSSGNGPISDHDANILRAMLDSVSQVVAFQRSQCLLDVNLLHSDPMISNLLNHIQASNLAEEVHQAAFYDMNSTLTYSDSQY